MGRRQQGRSAGDGYHPARRPGDRCPRRAGGRRPRRIRGQSRGRRTTGATFVTNADEYRASWVRIQSGFVDDPQASVTEAADLVAQISGSLVSAVQERERTLRGSWESGGNADTEALRNALREYRSFLERLMKV